jgi:hypothetical protein
MAEKLSLNCKDEPAAVDATAGAGVKALTQQTAKNAVKQTAATTITSFFFLKLPFFTCLCLSLCLVVCCFMAFREVGLCGLQSAVGKIRWVCERPFA